jgi:hypothetical protein
MSNRNNIDARIRTTNNIAATVALIAVLIVLVKGS